MKKILAVFAVIMIALTIVGFSYATWYSSVFINGNATVGSIDLQHYTFSVHNQTSPAATIGYGYPDLHHLTITIDGVYEGWKGFLNITVINAGTLPLKFYSFTTTIPASNATLASYFNLGFCAPIPPGYPYNILPDLSPLHKSLSWFSGTWYYEADWGISANYITLQPGQTHWNLISLDAPSIPNSFQGATLSVTFELQATLAT